MTDPVGENDAVVLFVHFRVLDDAHERCQASAGREQPQVLARQQVVGHQGAGGLAAHVDLVARLDVLQLGGQRAVLHLDAEELQFFFIVGAGNGIGAQQRAAVVLLQANHGEMSVLETKTRVPAGRKAEQGVVPVANAFDGFGIQIRHS